MLRTSKSINLADAPYSMECFLNRLSPPVSTSARLFQNELLERQTTACEAYVLDANARGTDWTVALAGTELVLRSHVCTMVLKNFKSMHPTIM